MAINLWSSSTPAKVKASVIRKPQFSSHPNVEVTLDVVVELSTRQIIQLLAIASWNVSLYALPISRFSSKAVARFLLSSIISVLIFCFNVLSLALTVCFLFVPGFGTIARDSAETVPKVMVFELLPCNKIN